MTDLFDRASQAEQDERERRLANHRHRAQERPDQDAHGRYCLDCGDIITPERIDALPRVVRCVDCQRRKERREAHYVAGPR